MFSKAFNFDLKPPTSKDIGYFKINYSLTFSGKVEASKPIIGATIKNDGEFEAALEAKVTESITAKIGLKAKQSDLDNIAESVKTGSKREVAKAIAKTLALETAIGGSITSYADAQAGVQFDECPFFIKVKGKVNEKYNIGQPVNFEASVEGGFFVGLSKKGWALVARKVGSPLVRRLLVRAGARFAPLLTSLTLSGVLTATAVVGGAILGTIVLTALVARLVANASTRGFMIGMIENWYKRAYVAKVFGDSRPTGHVAGNTYVKNPYKIRDQLIVEAEKDALKDARASCLKNNIKINNLKDKDLLDKYLEILVLSAGKTGRGSQITDAYKFIKYTEGMIKKMLNPKINKKFNIRMYELAYH